MQRELLERRRGEGRAQRVWQHIVRDDDVWYFVINEQRGGATKRLNEDTENHQEVRHTELYW